MNPKRTYIALCVLGFSLPYYFFVRFVMEHGLRLSILVNEIVASPAASFFAADVVVASLVLWVFIYHESRKRAIRLWWVCVLANLVVGVSLALPLFLLLREIQIQKEATVEGGNSDGFRE